MEIFQNEVWFVIGSQHLYGEETLRQVQRHAETVVAGLPLKLVLKPLVASPDHILALCRDANYQPRCLGLITWLHTFSPAKMWIGGLSILHKPLLQFHTQFNDEVPWQTMDMDFMNLNQTAHGGREFGFISARMQLAHQVVVGHWRDPRTYAEIGDWMREVAVTEGNKVSTQIQFGYSVTAYGLGDMVSVVDAVSDGDVDALIDEYESRYSMTPAVQTGGDRRENLLDAARIELGLKRFLQQAGCHAFTTNFENLYGLKQLPGLAVKRLMEQGYGFGGEGDWKTAALLRICKVMAVGLPGGTSFMEDYTYHFEPGNDLVVGSHMLEVCPSIALEEKPLLDAQYLGIGGKADPARLLFSTPAGPAVVASVIDLGSRFRLLVNVVDTIEQPQPLPKLPVAHAIWRAQPSLAVAAQAWITAGGAHHTVFSQALTLAPLRLYAETNNIELMVIDNETRLADFKQALRWNELYYNLAAS